MQEILLQCQSQANVFRANLDTTFRDQACQNKNLHFKFINCDIDSPDLDDLTLYFSPNAFLDIFSVRKHPTSLQTPFIDLAKLYRDHVKCRPKMFASKFKRTPFVSVDQSLDQTLSDSTSDEMVKHTFLLTLLPFQMFIMPQTYGEQLVQSPAFLRDFYIYDNDRVREIIGNSAAQGTFFSNDDNENKKYNDFLASENIEIGDLINSFLPEPVLGIGYIDELNEILTSLPKFDLLLCQRELEFVCSPDPTPLFPRTKKIITNQIQSSVKLADFAMFNYPYRDFERKTVNMTLECVDFCLYSGGQTDNNVQYGQVLANKIQQLYIESWIGQYFELDVKITEASKTVYFYQKSSKSGSESDRFAIYVSIPEKTIPYFLPLSNAKSLGTTANNNELVIETQLLSSVMHGFKAMPYASTTSLFFKSPYFLTFNSPHSNRNYFMFNDFTKPNLASCILAMLVYDENQNSFIAQFAPRISLPYLQSLSLNNTLEFSLYDATWKPVRMSFKSQLFVLITIE